MAFIISDIRGEWAIPEPLNYIPKGVPVLLVAHKKINGFVPTIAEIKAEAEVTPAQIGYNKLKEVTNATPGYVTDIESENYQKAYFNTKQIYVLYKNEFVLNKKGYLNKGKVYMENPNYNVSSPAPAYLKIAWGNLTNIHDIQKNGVTGIENAKWYTLDGRCLSGKPNTKGLYIVNGKKVVIK
jgi:hypothetical protein